MNPRSILFSRLVSLIGMVSLGMSGCLVTDADLSIEFGRKQPVLYCFLHPDSIVSMHLRYAKNPLDTSSYFFEDISIYLKEDGILVDTLLETEERGTYRSASFRPSTGKSYNLVFVSSELEETVETMPEIIPSPPVVDSIVLVDSAISIFPELYPRLRIYINKANRTHDSYIFRLYGYFDYFMTTYDTDDTFIPEGKDCTKNVLAFNYNNFEGKDFTCVPRGESIDLGLQVQDLHALVRMEGKVQYQFSWGVANRSATDFFTSIGANSGDFGTDELFFNPSVIKSNVPGFFGLFTAYSTVDFTFEY